MRSVALLAAGFSLALAAPCLAQTPSGSGTPTPGQSPIQVPSSSAGQPATQGGSQSTRPQITQSQASDQNGTVQSGMGKAAPSSASANAAGSNSSNGSNSSSSASGSGMMVAQQMKRDLQQAGFSDVKIMPESFLIRARDKEGRPVMMVVNPDSVVAMTKLGGGSSKMANSANSGGSGNGATNYQ